MAKTDPINIANPAGDSDPKFGDNYIRTLAKAVLELINKDHYIGAATDNAYDEDAAGEHDKITFNAPQSDHPANVANKGHFYTKDVDGKAELFWQDEDGNYLQLTTGGKLLLTENLIANDTYLIADNASSDATCDMIKVDANGNTCLPDGAVLAAATEDEDGDRTIVDKKYADDAMAAEVIARSFGTWQTEDTDSKTFTKDIEYTALSDGFVTVTNPSYAGEIKGYTPISTLRAWSSGNNGGDSGHSILMPVRKGDTWKILVPNGVATIYWLPFGSGGCEK